MDHARELIEIRGAMPRDGSAGVQNAGTMHKHSQTCLAAACLLNGVLHVLGTGDIAAEPQDIRTCAVLLGLVGVPQIDGNHTHPALAEMCHACPA